MEEVDLMIFDLDGTLIDSTRDLIRGQHVFPRSSIVNQNMSVAYSRQGKDSRDQVENYAFRIG